MPLSAPLCLLLAATAATAGAEPVEWRAGLGAQLDADSHGIADVGVRGGDWSAELLTDTLDLRWRPEGDRGRAWVALRANTFATGLFISPWADGAPDPGAALRSSAVGVESGAVRYLPRGFYAGVQGGLRWQWFGAMPTTTVDVPAGRPVGTADLVLGWWRPDLHMWSRAGADATSALDGDSSSGVRIAPHVQVELVVAPDWQLAPVVELRAGAADEQDDVLRTRMGGLNPYVVPVAGAAWAEWWVEDFAAARLGLRLRLAVGHGGELRLMPFLDAATAEEIVSSQPAGPWALGVGGWVRASQGRSHLDLAVGHAPWIERQPDVGRWSVFVLATVDWGSGSRIWRVADD